MSAFNSIRRVWETSQTKAISAQPTPTPASRRKAAPNVPSSFPPIFTTTKTTLGAKVTTTPILARTRPKTLTPTTKLTGIGKAKQSTSPSAVASETAQTYTPPTSTVKIDTSTPSKHDATLTSTILPPWPKDALPAVAMGSTADSSLPLSHARSDQPTSKDLLKTSIPSDNRSRLERDQGTPDIAGNYVAAHSPIHAVPREEPPISESIYNTLAEVLFNVGKAIAVPLHFLSPPEIPPSQKPSDRDAPPTSHNGHLPVDELDAQSNSLKQFSDSDDLLALHASLFRRRRHGSATLQAAATAVDNSLEDLILRRIFNNVCLHQDLQAQQLQVLSIANPTWAARILLSRTDIMATRTADGLAITRCQQVEADHIFDKHEVNGTCYLLTPVLIGTHLWFSLPGTKDLIESSPTTPCPYPADAQSVPPQRLLPPNVRLNSAAQAFLFNPPSTFFSTIDSSEVASGFHMNTPQKNKPNTPFRLSKRGIFGDAWMAVKNTTLKVRHSLKDFYDSTTDKLTAGVETLKRSILRAILWIIIPTVIIVILIGCCVLYIKFYFLRRATATASSALFEVARNFAPRKRNRGNTANAIRTHSPNELEMEEPLFVPRIYAIANMTNTVHSALPYIELTVNKVKVTALIDSGASISYMRLSTLHDVAPLTSFLPKNTTATAANGTTIHLMAAVKIPITIGRYTISHQLWIASDSDCPAQVLLGSDFIRQLNKTGLPISLDLHKHVIAIGGEYHNLVHVNHVTLRTETPLHVMTEGMTTLPRRTASIVRTKIHGCLPTETRDVLIEDNQRMSDGLYVVGRALVSLNMDGSSFINIMNPSNTDIQLKDKTKIAWATPIVYPEVQILAVHQQTATGPMAPSNGVPASEISPEADWETKLPHFPITPPPNYDVCTEIDLSGSALMLIESRLHGRLLGLPQFHGLLLRSGSEAPTRTTSYHNNRYHEYNREHENGRCKYHD
ncbi:unnamed protein product [Heligmosomoides polygyrus]|uniref:Peptidase A2 domain-containing protein n=1 Tax=Heligmosomoides polygyrus TaxID=6339 RepID=A0A183F4Y9_HELPZ|nr:unnamed protein product [Heligmosomoides polygyrus]